MAGPFLLPNPVVWQLWAQAALALQQQLARGFDFHRKPQHGAPPGMLMPIRHGPWHRLVVLVREPARRTPTSMDSSASTRVTVARILTEDSHPRFDVLTIPEVVVDVVVLGH